MGDIDWLKIVKWVAIVLVAGFIGQFGKMLANHFVSKAKRKKDKSPQRLVEDGQLQNKEEPAFHLPVDSVKDTAKEEKKILKAMAKQKKKEAKARLKKTED